MSGSQISDKALGVVMDPDKKVRVVVIVIVILLALFALDRLIR